MVHWHMYYVHLYAELFHVKVSDMYMYAYTYMYIYTCILPSYVKSAAPNSELRAVL